MGFQIASTATLATATLATSLATEQHDMARNDDGNSNNEITATTILENDAYKNKMKNE